MCIMIIITFITLPGRVLVRIVVVRVVAAVDGAAAAMDE